MASDSVFPHHSTTASVRPGAVGVDFGLVVCGAGPAGTGPFIAAARDGRLDELLDLGVILIERNSPGSGKIGDYRIAANSLGLAFLEGVDGIDDGPLAGLARCPEAERLRVYASGHPPLSVVAPFLDRVGEAVADVLREHPRCRVVTGVTVEEIRHRPDGGVMVLATGCAGGSDMTVTAGRALIAMGGQSDTDLSGVHAEFGSLLEAARDRTVHADQFIDRTRAVPPAVLRSIEETGRVAVVGCSHSAWSVALLLHHAEIEGMTRRVDPLDIVLLARSGVRLYYRTVEEAMADGHVFNDADVCPLSGRVNRYSGLRAAARELARATLGFTDEPSPVRVMSLANQDPARLRDELAGAGAVVLATGHRARLPRLRWANGAVVRAAHADGGTVVDDLGRLVDSDGTVHPSFIVYGLGAGLRPSAAIGGEPSFHRRATGVWLYQNHLGSVVVGDLLSTAERRAVDEVPS